MSSRATRVIALDGPSGSGKSTVAKRVAGRLGWRYVDTGATYRAATLAALRAGVDLQDEERVTAVVVAARIELSTDPGSPGVRLDGEDVGTVIRGAEVTGAVSAVSAVPGVRAHLVALQRSLAGDDGAVLEGRDTATAVMPAALVKVYLDASPEVRAGRRAGDDHAGVRPAAAGSGPTGGSLEPSPDHGSDQGPDHDLLLTSVAADLARRDRLDSSRAVDPLRLAPDAVHLDSSALVADEVVDRVLALARAAGLVP